MTTELDELTPFSSHDAILDAIEDLVRRHGLAMRLDLGRTLLRVFFDDDLHAYQDRNPNKERRFTDFFAEHAERLQRYEVSDAMARRCIKAWSVYRALPEEQQASLLFTHLRELTKVLDPTDRLRLAGAAVQHDWSVRQLADAVTALRQGVDGEALAGQVDPTALVDADAAPLAPGRLVTRAEKWAAELEDWGAQWQAARPAKLREAHCERLRAAVVALRAQLDAVEAELQG